MVGAVVLIIACILVIGSVVMQESSKGGIGAIGGGVSETHYDKSKGRTNEAALAMITKVSAIALFVITGVVLFISITA